MRTRARPSLVGPRLHHGPGWLGRASPGVEVVGGASAMSRAEGYASPRAEARRECAGRCSRCRPPRFLSWAAFAAAEDLERAGQPVAAAVFSFLYFLKIKISKIYIRFEIFQKYTPVALP